MQQRERKKTKQNKTNNEKESKTKKYFSQTVYLINFF